MVDPDTVHFKGKPGEAMRKTVRITPKANQPFTIREAKAWKGKFITFKLDQYPKDKSYILTIESKTTQQSVYFDRIDLMTDSTVKPIIPIKVFGRFF